MRGRPLGPDEIEAALRSAMEGVEPAVAGTQEWPAGLRSPFSGLGDRAARMSGTARSDPLGPMGEPLASGKERRRRCEEAVAEGRASVEASAALVGASEARIARAAGNGPPASPRARS